MEASTIKSINNVAKFTGSFINGMARGTSTTLVLVTTGIRSIETAAIKGVSACESMIPNDHTEDSARNAFKQGFKEGETLLRAATDVLTTSSFTFELNPDSTTTI